MSDCIIADAGNETGIGRLNRWIDNLEDRNAQLEQLARDMLTFITACYVQDALPRKKHIDHYRGRLEELGVEL